MSSSRAFESAAAIRAASSSSSLPCARTDSRIAAELDRKSTRLNSSHTVIYTLSLHDALPILDVLQPRLRVGRRDPRGQLVVELALRPDRLQDRRRARSEEHTSELQSHRDLHSFPTRRSSDLRCPPAAPSSRPPRSARPARRRACPAPGPTPGSPPSGPPAPAGSAAAPPA